MKRIPPPLDLSRLRVLPLEERASLSRIEDVLVDPASVPRPVDEAKSVAVRAAAERLRAARDRDASVLLICGAHLLRNGAALILERLLVQGWISHLAVNGAASIHDWEFAWLGRSTESVEANVAAGTFGAWAETGRNIHLALLAGGIADEGYGRALGRFIHEDGTTLPSAENLEESLRAEPGHPLAPARADLLRAMRLHHLAVGRHTVVHAWKDASLFRAAFRCQVALTVHPGIGYDIISNHPMFNGAVIGRAAERDFRQFAAAVDGLDGGVVLSIGSAIMGPQVFEKSLSCVHNLRLQQGRSVISGHTIYVVDLQDGGQWDWSRGEPAKTNPAYYLRFCKSYARMGGAMHYVQCDNLAFVHHLYHELSRR
jgi:hypothetical protein